MLDMGKLSEYLLFYRNIKWVCHPSSAVHLANKIGTTAFSQLIDDFGLELYLLRDHFTVLTHKTGFDVRHDIGNFEIAQTAGNIKIDDEKFIDFAIGRASVTNDSLLTTLRKGRLIRHNDSFYFGQTIADTRKDLFNKNLFTEDARQIIKSTCPHFDLPKDFFFYGSILPDGHFTIKTNLSYIELRKYMPNADAQYGPKDLLTQILQARHDLALCATQRSDFLVDTHSMSFIQQRVQALFDRTMQSRQQINLFTEHAIGTDASLSDRIRNQIDFSKFLEVLEKAKKFKDYIHQLDDRSDLISQYMADVMKEASINKGSRKYYRYVVMAGAGLIAEAAMPSGYGLAVSLGIGATDSLLIDKIARGWRPNQFIDEQLQPFLAKTS
jgi:hypothetical protein